MDSNRRDWLRGVVAAGIGAAALGTREAPAMGSGRRPDEPEPLPRVARFEGLAYGLFLHWGLYSQLGKGEWAKHFQKIPTDEYMKLRATFRAEEFSGRAIARTARRAGMRYATLTSRHHDGFSLYDTRGLSELDVTKTPAGRDLILDFVEGCRAEGILPILYHTTLDWSDPRFESDFDAYLEYLRRSVEVLCTHYGALGGLWFDGNWSKPKADWREDDLYATIRRLQPEAMIINNTGLDERGRVGHPEIDCVTFEKGRPTAMDRHGMTKYVAAEMCQTMNYHWGIGAADFDYKSPADVIEDLAGCRRVGANLLLNVGPTASGRIPDYEAAALARAGDWVGMHEDAIRDGRPAGIVGEGVDFGLATEDAVYLFVHGLSGRRDTPGKKGAGPRAFTGITRKIASAAWIDDGQELKVESGPEAGALTLHATGFPYGTDTVVRVARLALRS